MKNQEIKNQGFKEKGSLIKDNDILFLEGSPESDEWQFKEFSEAQIKSRLKLNWQPTFPIADCTTSTSWYIWKKYAKALCIQILSLDESSIKSSSQKTTAQNIKYVCQYFCFIRKCPNISSVSQNDVDCFEEYLKSKKLSWSYVAELLRTTRLFWLNKIELKEGLAFDPYPPWVNINLRVKALAFKSGHTHTLAPQTGLLVINHALKIVMESENTLMRYDYYKSLKKDTTKRGRVSLKYKQKFCESIKILYHDIRVLYGAAIILIFSLTAMRKHEINNILYEDAVLLLGDKVNVLSGKVDKTAKTSTGKMTERQSIKELKVALEIIVRITELTRVRYNSPYLLLRLPFCDSVSNNNPSPELTAGPMYKILNKFSQNLGLEEQKLRPHMFRRFFAMLWAWRFETGDLHYLSQLLFHNGYEFTKVYVEDEDVWDFMPEEMKEFTYQVFEKMFLGQKKIGGGFSRTLNRYKRIIQSNVSISSPKNIENIIESLIQRNDYVVVPAADGYCFMSKHNAPRSKCSSDGTFPDYSNRSEFSCSSCSNFGVADDRSEYWEIRYKAHKKTFENSVTKELKNAAEEGMMRSYKMLSSMKIEDEK